MKIKELLIRKELFKLSKDVGLNFSQNLFKMIWITKEQEILTEYLSDCKDKVYEKYGKNINRRLQNLEKFYSSKDYKKCIKRYGGQVFNKRSISDLKSLRNNIKNKQILDILNDLLFRIKKANNSRLDRIALLTETKKEKELQVLCYKILRHEWIHILLEENKIRFKDWRYNEGIVTYFEAYLDHLLSYLDKPLKKEKYSFNIECLKKAIYFKNVLGYKPDVKKIKYLMEKKLK
jgi:hypothetical protein